MIVGVDWLEQYCWGGLITAPARFDEPNFQGLYKEGCVSIL